MLNEKRIEEIEQSALLMGTRTAGPPVPTKAEMLELCQVWREAERASAADPLHGLPVIPVNVPMPAVKPPAPSAAPAPGCVRVRRLYLVGPDEECTVWGDEWDGDDNELLEEATAYNRGYQPTWVTADVSLPRPPEPPAEVRGTTTEPAP